MFVEVIVDMRETSSATENDEENTSSRSSERFPRVGMENTGEPGVALDNARNVFKMVWDLQTRELNCRSLRVFLQAEIIEWMELP